MDGGLSQPKKVNFLKRKDCIMKKIRELSVLCDVKACAIVFRPDDGRVETWPENLNEVQQVINAYRDYSFKKKKSADGDVKKRKLGDNKTACDDFIGVEKKQKLSSDTEIEFLGDELKKIESTLEQVRNRIRILKQQEEGYGHGYGYGHGSSSSFSSSEHFYDDFAATIGEDKSLLQIEDFDRENNSIFTLNELEMIQESSDKEWMNRRLSSGVVGYEYQADHSGLWSAFSEFW